MSSPETKEQQAPTGPAATVDERVLAMRAREA